MSSKPLLFQIQHKQWQLKVKRERQQTLEAHNAGFYASYSGELPT
jgi:hypothetical protein